MQLHKRKLERVIYEIAQTLELEILDPMKLTNITQMEYFITVNKPLPSIQSRDLFSPVSPFPVHFFLLID